MECQNCLEGFNQLGRLPKTVPCGHTACLWCLRSVKGVDRTQCPACRRVFDIPPDTLPTNSTLLRLIVGADRPPGSRSSNWRDVLPKKKAASTKKPSTPPAAPSPPPAAPSPAPPQPVGEMYVDDVSQNGPNQRQQEKAKLLAEATGVIQLVGLWCNTDPAWSFQLLQRAAPTLERLRVIEPGEVHLRAVHAMPRLSRLAVTGGAALTALPPELPALPPGHAGLQWLRVSGLPRATTKSLLRAHGGTLEELELYVGVGTVGSKGWPWSCGDLHSLLNQSGLRALKWIVLRRNRCSHEPSACREQRAEVRRVLPGAEVQCGDCDRL